MHLCFVLTSSSIHLRRKRMSLQTIVLRYYDFDYNTIAEHLRVIGEMTFTWWGWWKKIEEPWQGRALEEVVSRCPLRIGLVNRTAKEYYAAQCERVVHEANGSGVDSPEREFTPAYYRYSAHPA